MPTETDQPTPPQTPAPAAKSTLTIGGSVGGTLSIGGGSATPAASRPAGSGIAVEVRRRRFDAPNPLNAPAAAPTVAGNPEEMQRRLQALNAAQGAPSASPTDALPAFTRVEKPVAAPSKSATSAAPAAAPLPPVRQMDPALALMARLQDDRIRDAEARVQQNTIRRAEEKAEAERLAAERAARSRAGSGAGGVQSGTLAGGAGNAARSVNSRDFTKANPTTNDRHARAGASTGGKPEARDLQSKRGRNAYLEDLAERQRAMSSGSRRRGRHGPAPEVNPDATPAEKVIRDVVVGEFITVGELASRMAEKASDVVKKLMLMGEMVTVNQTIDQDTAELIVGEFGHRIERQQAVNLEEELLEVEDAADQGRQITRPPVVTIMGHVDHGKTTLLDTLRKAAVAKGEAGGITQHIGAYQITAPSGRLITFLDTPGHAAFTAMRARGAQVTDVVILVVAADDGIMPQTIEAIQHARAAKVPLVVALNKMDKPGVNPAKVKNELLAQEVVIEEFGGEVPCVPVSGLTGLGLGELEEVVLLQADVLDLKANPDRRADGAVVEARLDKGRGPVATVIVQRGTLRLGDIVAVGAVWGRVRALVNDQGENIKEAGPSMPVEILGLQGVPAAGDQFIVAADERKAREAASWRENNLRERDQAARKLTLEGLMERFATGDQRDLNIIVKADVQGSVEAINYALGQLNNDQTDVRVKMISGGVGVITENDVNLATTAGALVIGFNVRADATARTVAERLGVELRYYSIIYNLVDDIKAAMSGLLAPSQVEEINGQAEIRAIFTFEKTKIAGCMVTSGKLTRGSQVRLLRDGIVIHTGELGSLRRGKDDAKDVAAGFECGTTLVNYTDFREADVLEAFSFKEVKRTIDDLKTAGASRLPVERSETLAT